MDNNHKHHDKLSCGCHKNCVCNGKCQCSNCPGKKDNSGSQEQNRGSWNKQ